jgi:hypothetical protein
VLRKLTTWLLLGCRPGPSRTITLVKAAEARTLANNSSEMSTPRVSAAESARIRIPAGRSPSTPTITNAKMPIAIVTSTRLKPPRQQEGT